MSVSWNMWHAYAEPTSKKSESSKIY